jgi:glyoxylase-like metal-dependent hydrolase (beta-lactamase superfamily II)
MSGCIAKELPSFPHENTRKHLAIAQTVEDWDFDFPSSPSGAIPTYVFASERTVNLNGATFALKHYGPAHTDGDISVSFTDAEILHAGDTFWNGVTCSWRSVGTVNRPYRPLPACLDMLAQLRDDKKQLATHMRETHGLCDEHGVVASASLLETWIDEAERRAWFLFEAGRPGEPVGHAGGA